MVHRACKMLEILLVCYKCAVKIPFHDVILKASFKNATTFVAELLIPFVQTKERQRGDSNYCTDYEVT